MMLVSEEIGGRTGVRDEATSTASVDGVVIRSQGEECEWWGDRFYLVSALSLWLCASVDCLLLVSCLAKWSMLERIWGASGCTSSSDSGLLKGQEPSQCPRIFQNPDDLRGSHGGHRTWPGTEREKRVFCLFLVINFTFEFGGLKWISGWPQEY
ncbi:hypothetical protein C8F04DRAFT_1141122 [Mycena alexandri]|uniref:Uncharacterized protein n=1 Tax=Mycena alexandri TaxID=1745969 RepID=A0AAD6WQH0_9AGAR|nr:hypothetical protein C8F04DRAFT_1141122 [Mycena alexandri]